jgi:hypothetical protein
MHQHNEVYTKPREMLPGNQNILLKLEQLDRKIINFSFYVKMCDGAIATFLNCPKRSWMKNQATGSRNACRF